MFIFKIDYNDCLKFIKTEIQLTYKRYWINNIKMRLCHLIVFSNDLRIN